MTSENMNRGIKEQTKEGTRDKKKGMGKKEKEQEV